MKPIQFPSSFLFGSATAATQIEGGDINSNWYAWSLAGKIHNGASSITAADHWNRVKEDIDLMKELNHQVYRMSIEWSRIEPSMGQWSQEGIDHYRDELTQLKQAEIKPLVSLHHFSSPQWFEEMGGWTNPESVDLFTRFVEKIVMELGDLVSEYCTINEPNVLATGAYIDGNFPPGHKDDIKGFFKASKNLILAHLKAYQSIHAIRKEKGFEGETKVGFAHHAAVLTADSKNPLTQLSRKMMDYSFHQIFEKGFIEGELVIPIGSGYPQGKGCFCDFLGINYYSRHIIKNSWNPAMLFGQVSVDPSLQEGQKNDMGWELYPTGLYEVIVPLYQAYRLPVYITENGIPDEKDTKRAKFIYDHLAQVKRLIDAGVDVQRYYYWSLMDNLEWADGYWPRFGLIEVDYETMERRVRKSGNFYSAICTEKAITQTMIENYLKEEE
jgi:beta-glucosidase